MKRFLTSFFSLAISLSAQGAVFQQFAPATGILKGNVNTYITTAAVWADLSSLLTGTCNNTTVVYGDGHCASAGGVSLSGNNVWTGSNSYTLPVTLTSSTTTELRLTNTGNSSGDRTYNFQAESGGNFSLNVCDDTWTTCNGFISGNRVGNDITSVALQSSIPSGAGIFSSTADSGTSTVQSVIDVTAPSNAAAFISAAGTSTQATLDLSADSPNGLKSVLILGTADDSTSTLDLSASQVQASAASPDTTVNGELITSADNAGALTTIDASMDSGNTAARLGLSATPSSGITEFLGVTENSAISMISDPTDTTIAINADSPNTLKTASISWQATNAASSINLAADTVTINGLPIGSGTVSSVGMTVPSFLSVSGSPVTTSGTLAVSLSGTALPVANGGTGVTSLSSLTANPTASIGLSAINGSASTFMRSDAAPALSQAISPTWTGNHTFTASSGTAITTTRAAGGLVVLANGFGTNNGYMQIANNTANTILGVESSTGSSLASGAAANASVLTTVASTSLCLGTSSTARECWTSAGNGTVNAPSSGTTLTLNAVSAADPALNLASGTLALNGAEGTAGQFLTSQGPSAAPTWTTAAISSTSGSFTATWTTGCTTSPASTIFYTVNGNIVTIIDNAAGAWGITCTSNTINGFGTGNDVPAAARPARTVFFTGSAQDNGGSWVPVECRIQTSGAINCFANLNAGSFTASGTRGIRIPATSYVIN